MAMSRWIRSSVASIAIAVTSANSHSVTKMRQALTDATERPGSPFEHRPLGRRRQRAEPASSVGHYPALPSAGSPPRPLVSVGCLGGVLVGLGLSRLGV